jgi:hypothetical protein
VRHNLKVATNVVGLADNYVKTIVTSNSSANKKGLSDQVNALMIKPTCAVVNTGATSIFILEGTPCKNIRLKENPITILLLDEKKVTSTHICNIEIPGLPFTLVGHIVPNMKMASLLDTSIVQGRLHSCL